MGERQEGTRIRMTNRGTQAYDVPARVAAYDRDMRIMHPNRERMIEVALDFLPASPDAPLRFLDLGAGTGLFAAAVLARHPRASVVAVDGAAEMSRMAEARLGRDAVRVDFVVGDFRDLGALLAPGERFDAIVSSFALHHLDGAEKVGVLGACVERLRPGAWLCNADLIVQECDELEARIQELRVAGIVARVEPDDERFGTPGRARGFLDELEEREGDQPLTLREDIDCMRRAGLESVAVIWTEYREAVCVGRRPA